MVVLPFSSRAGPCETGRMQLIQRPAWQCAALACPVRQELRLHGGHYGIVVLRSSCEERAVDLGKPDILQIHWLAPSGEQLILIEFQECCEGGVYEGGQWKSGGGV